MNKYMSEIIGDEYQQWNETDVILLTAPTGAGKTEFIFGILLPYIKDKLNQDEKPIKILYLVNRTILKQQLEDRKSRLPMELKDRISIELYQTLEKKIINKQDAAYKEYDYVVCDEAHYFSSDSLFNTYTQISYDWIRDVYFRKIRIYISATLGLVKDKIIDDINNRVKVLSPIYSVPTGMTESYRIFGTFKRWEYESDRSYSNIACYAISNIEKLVEEISNSKDKWLIFVDSIRYGKKLKRLIASKMDKEDSSVLFLDSNYRKDGKNIQEVNTIVREQKQAARVLICTSVMDNGISLKDYRLKNIVITADVKDEFLQMIGRKRFTDESATIYLVNKTQEEINRRLYEINLLNKLCSDCVSYLMPTIQKIALCNQKEIKEEQVDRNEWTAVVQQSIHILPKLFTEEGELIKSIFYPRDGILFLNMFSVKRVEYLSMYYTELLEALQYDEFALIRKQLTWLEKEEEEVEEIISESHRTEYEICWNQVVKSFESYIGKQLTEKEYVQIKVQLKEQLKYIVNEMKDKEPKQADVILNGLAKNDRGLSGKNISWLQKYCSFPYEVETLTDETDDEIKYYKIYKTDKSK